MEASALHAPAIGRRLSLTTPLLRLRSDEQLVALFRMGSEDAFTGIHDRYRQRLFAYVRQMLSGASRQDAEDVLQDVFVRAYGALRADEREINLRAWLYRVAHNRCIDHVRRPTPPAADVFDMSRSPLHDPMETAQRRESLRRLVEDVGRLPDQQRSALLMREIDGMAYADIAEALDVTVPAVKSLLVRARVGLVEAQEARDTDCSVIRADLAAAYDRGVKASGRARRHMRECSGCREYRTGLRAVRRSFAALAPAGAFAPVALVAKVLGLGGGAGGGAAVGGSAAVGGAGVVGSGAAAATACKVAAVVCTAAITAGGAVEVKRLAVDDRPARGSTPAAAAAAAPAKQRSAIMRGQAVTEPVHRGLATAESPSAARTGDLRASERAAAPLPAEADRPRATVDQIAAPALDEASSHAATGGALGPVDEIGAPIDAEPQPLTTTDAVEGTGTPEAAPASTDGEAQPADAQRAGAGSADEHSAPQS